MTPEQQAKETAESLAAFVASERDVTTDVPDWPDGSARIRLATLYGKSQWGIRRMRAASQSREPVDQERQEAYDNRLISDHEAAALILRAFQGRLDEAGVSIKKASKGFFVERAAKDEYGDWIWPYLSDGTWTEDELPTRFSSRPLAMLAAIQAMEADKD